MNGEDVEEGNPYAVTPEETETVSSTFEVAPQEASLNNGEDFEVEQGEDSISGETNLAPGTELTIRTQASGIFYEDADVTVQEDGTFSADFDFSDVDNGTEFSATLGGIDFTDRNADVTGVVNANLQDDPTTTTTTTTDETTDDETTDNDDGQPGFGIAISVVALLAAALLALRREN